VLINIFGKDPLHLFNEFAGKDYDDQGFDGDVKYHLGYSAKKLTRSGKEVGLTLCPNPSHLETVDPIVEGLTRARIDHYLISEEKICPILIHGDAAIAAQGIVYEVVQMAGLNGYKTGGTVHIVINNQVGFTTNYIDGRTSTYCTDVAKVTLSPVFHVNGDDPEAVVHVIHLALKYRQLFKHDVFIDLLCYRKYGHNEGDEPRFTQPTLYKLISKHPNPRDIYVASLLDQGVVTKEKVLAFDNDFSATLDQKYQEAQAIPMTTINNFLDDLWCDLRPSDPGVFEKEIKTGVSMKKLLAAGKHLTSLPSDKTFFKKIEKLVEDRRKMLFETEQLDWAMGELLAYATLLTEGHSVRISGQDVERGTFSHRHAVLTQEDSEERYVPLRNLETSGAKFNIYNSLLSEYGVLGFEYGYALGAPSDLVIWEAQFGDFFNGAQIIFDQFISAAEDKWRVQNGLVMLLPHGYEGQGAEHSSARIERFLTLCAEKNMLIVNCTTPANLFHVLRRQMKQPFRKPLVIFTPKSLLRHPRCVSPVAEFTTGSFTHVFDDPNVSDKKKIDRVLLMSGKVYYDLMEERETRKANDAALIRIEQLYPFPTEMVKKILAGYPNAQHLLWVQEEPQNMGAWSYINTYHSYLHLRLASIPRSASPATGSPTRHKQRVAQLMEDAFTL
jgi:2-oxoglutarate dehydrogenase E1 component